MANGYTAQVGDSIDNRGVPYYMAQLNEFVRTFAQEFNRVQNGGYDLHDNPGVDFFNATVKATGDNYIFQESVDFGGEEKCRRHLHRFLLLHDCIELLDYKESCG